MENLSGHNVKGYELRERVGAGGFGAVYKAYQSTVGREVAMKIILPGYANQPDFIRRFETEAQVVARLEHPYIVPLYDYWRDPDGAYLIMRFLRGGSLRDALQNGPFDLETTAVLLEQITAALAIAHRNNVIHRDIKPGNILLDEDGNTYLADFGIAKDLAHANGGKSHTQADAIIGSLDYLSPEQARSEPVTPRTDIYSLGVVLYEVLTGQHPFHGISSIERLYKHINDPLPDITTLDSTVQDSINRVIQKATAKNPAHRYTEALEFAAAFREAAELNRTPTSHAVVELLTMREQEILQFIINGLSNKEIAARLTVTVQTVKWYINQIYRKLHVRSRVQAIVRARELNLVINGTGADVSRVSVPTSNLPEPENPYKGLRAFEAADERDYFGREELVKQLIHKMAKVGAHVSPLQDEKMFGRFLAVVGPSGSGKSSLVKAGLIPVLWRGGLAGSEKWFVVEMIPGQRPLDELEIGLIKIAPTVPPNLREQLARDEHGLTRAAQLILPKDGSELVFVIDQFEEVFTLVENEAARVHFLKMLTAAVTDARSRVRVVITLRADFYDRPLHYPEFGELVRNRMETILPLTAKGLERAIAGPAERVGVTFEEGLVAQIVSDMNYQAGALPLLQYALTELFEQRQGRILTHETYHQIGGAVGALARRAEAIFEELSLEAQEVARQMFLRLVTLGDGTEDTRRRTLRSELLAISDFTPHPKSLSQASEARDLNSNSTPFPDFRESSGMGSELIEDIIDTFAEYRLLTLDTDPATRTPTIEVAHEAILREWERLRNWLNESRDDIRQQRLLSYAAGEWKDNKRDASFLLTGSRLEQFESWKAYTQLALTPLERDFLAQSLKEQERQKVAEQERQAREASLEKRSVRTLRALVAVLTIALLGAVGLTGLAVNQSQIAQQNEKEARSFGLASSAQLALNEGNIDQAIKLSEESLAISSNPLAENVLGQASFAPQTPQIFQETGRFVPHVLGSQEEDMNFVIVAHFGPGIPFSDSNYKGMEDACATLNATCTWLGEWPSPETDVLGEMNKNWEKALTMKPDGIGTTVIDSELTRPYAERATEMGIPVVIFNSSRGLESSASLPALLYIGPEEFAGGKANAKRVFAEAQTDGVTIRRGVCANQFVQASFLQAHCAGAQSIFDQQGVPFDQIEISDESRELAAQQIADYFVAHPDTNAIFMLGPGPSESLNIYLQQAGRKPRELYATTRDTSLEIFQMIKDGYLLQALDGQPYMQGYQTIFSLYLYTQYGVRPSGYMNTSSAVDLSNLNNIIQLTELGYR